MFKHYCTVAIRIIRRSFLFSSINILGFVLGMTAAFLNYLWVVDELTFEDFHKNGDSIYRIVEASKDKTGKVTESASTVAPLADAFRKEFSQVQQTTYIKYEDKISLQYEDKIIQGSYAYVDTTFFDMFSFPVVEGNLANFKKSREQLVLTEPIAKKLFGNSSAIGKQIPREFTGQTTYYTVAAVIKIPRKSHIQVEVIFNTNAYPFPMEWAFYEHIHAYIQLKDNVRLSATDLNTMSEVLSNKTGKEKQLFFQPLNDIHLHTHFKDPMVNNYGSMSQIYLFIALSLLVIFMGAFNFTTLSTARASSRFKEIGVRKVTGAKRKTLITQFLSESMVQAFLSLVLALALTELLLPLFNMMLDKDIVIRLNWQVILFVFLGIFGVGFLAGSYPAFYMSALNPLLAFKGGMANGKKRSFIKILVCVQFVIAITLILCTSIVFKQLHYLQNFDLGLNKENIITIESSLWYNVANFKQEALKNPNVKSVAMGVSVSDYLKGNSWETNRVEWYKDNGQTDSLTMVRIWADADFAKAFGLTIVKGETLKSDLAEYWNGSYNFPVLINEAAWKAMRVENPIGMQLNNAIWAGKAGTITGVVKDFNFQTLKEKIKPAYIFYNPESLGWLHIKMAAENKPETLKFLKETYQKMRPGQGFTYQFFTNALNQNYTKEQQQSRVFLLFTILAVIIAMMGVFGLVALSTRQRTKEIGIRKVNGAHSKRIVKMFCLEYIQWIGIAFVVACPLGYFFMYNWLSSFAYQTAISWWLFPLAGLIILVITLVTVIIQTYHTASQNPVTSLRYE